MDYNERRLMYQSVDDLQSMVQQLLQVSADRVEVVFSAVVPLVILLMAH